MSGSRSRGRRQEIHGPIFKSFYRQQDSPNKMQWKRHQGSRQQVRYLRHRCDHLLNSKDPAIIAVGDRVIMAVKDEPNPEYGALHLMAAGLDASEQTGVSWIDAMTYLLNKFDNMERDEHGSVATGN